MDLPFAKELLNNGGPLALTIIVIWLFLRHIHQTAQEHRAWMEQILKGHAETLKQVHAENLTAREATRQVITSNTAAMLDNTKALAQLSASVSNLRT